MQMVSVKSSNLAAIGYDLESKTLRVLFQEGRCYDYLGVSQKVYEQLMAAESKGHFFQDVIRERYSYEKVNLEKESKQMAKNRQQAAADARAKAAAQNAAQPAVGSKPGQISPDTGKVNEAAPAAAAQPNKQAETITKLKAAWAEKKVDVSKLKEVQDGKYINLIPGEGWPTIRIGASGGIVVLELRSYASAFDAAVDGKALYDKQKARDAKKQSAASAPAPAAQPAPLSRKQGLRQRSLPRRSPSTKRSSSSCKRRRRCRGLVESASPFGWGFSISAKSGLRLLLLFSPAFPLCFSDPGTRLSRQRLPLPSTTRSSTPRTPA
ncbi:MAG TPA: KTSC domain-containing protein, partial [Dongiaceae bacterium]|nr:KTSC domain-containing protein [Dongiaceae bacterium]